MAFSFGASNTPAPAFGSTASTSNFGAAAGGFSLGGSNGPPVPAPAIAGSAGGFSFGQSSAMPAPTTTAPSGGLVNFGGSTSAPRSISSTTSSSGLFSVPDFEVTFPFLSLLTKIRELDAKMSSSGREAEYAAQELLQLIGTSESLADPPAPLFTAPNDSIRRQLQSNPNVTLRKTVAVLTPKMLREVFAIADALHLPEQDAMVLFAQASQPQTRHYVEACEETSPVLNDVPSVACALFFQQRLALLKALTLLSQCRLEEKHLEATDELLLRNLIPNLVSFVRNLTTLIAQVRPQPSQTQRLPQSMPMETQSVEEASPWLDHLHQERQMAVECLFYLTYSSQCKVPEVALLLDLIQELTNNGLSALDPVQDVPDAHHPQAFAMPQWGPFTQALPPLREKTKWDWEMELVKSVWNREEPYVLQCSSVLIMAVLCALDTQQCLLNRDTHSVNDFGVGNVLFRSQDTFDSFDDIGPIHQRLEVTAAEKWKRKDVWGVMAAAYALALRPVSSVLASPRSQPTANASIVKRTWKACLTSPSDHKSFTFVRLTLVPAFSNSSRKSERCDLRSFLLTVLTEFMSNYLDVVCACNAIPFSRSKWQDNETERLLIAKEEQQRNRSFFQSYGGAYEERLIPNEVDLLKRPDCIDDIVAVAIDLCTHGPEYSARFWTAEEYRSEDESIQTRFVASRALKTLEILQDKDQSLIPIYLSFLAALAIAEPSLVFELLNKHEETSGKVSMNWTTLFDTLRWYVRQMGDNYAGDSKPATASVTQSVVSSGYYYGADDPSISGSAGAFLSTTSATLPSNSRLEELRETNTAVVMSHLAVITKVAATYARGRTSLVAMKLSIDGNAIDQEGDSVLVVLFSLAISPLSPQVRGAVFATIAALLRLEGTSPDEEVLIRDLARKGWDLLELSQAVPVVLLDQYPMKSSTIALQDMSFPPSSLSMASSGAIKAWLPADPKYGMLFEMEHVESQCGCYPSTEGLLQLLTSLVTAAGCPSDLGQASEDNKVGRTRPGSTPYVEYVAYFVIPRSLGSRAGDDKLPFKTGADSSRLVARALEVIEAVATRYSIPASVSKIATYSVELQNHTKMLDVASTVLRLPLLAKTLILTPTESGLKTAALDFESNRTTVPISDNTKLAMSLPRVKSPGYTILADILSTTDSELLKALGLILTQDGGRGGVHSFCSQRDFSYSVAWALFGDTAPSVATAKYKYDDGVSFVRQSLLCPLLPPIDVNGDLHRSTDSVYWRVKSIAISLRILGAVAVKEREFVRALGGVTTVVPALHFNPKMNVIHKKEVHLTSVRDALLQPSSIRFLPSVTQYLASISSDDIEDSEISGTALALLMYCSAQTSASTILSALDGQSVAGELRFARDVAERLTISSKRTDHIGDSDIVRVILDLLQSELAHVLLGFPHKSIDGLDSPGVVSSPGSFEQHECFTVLLDLLGDDEFLTNPTSSSFASTGFEIIYNIISSIDQSPMGRQRAEHLSTRLKARDFWNVGALRFLASRECGDPSLLGCVNEVGTERDSKGADIILHQAAWFLKGLAVHCVTKMQRFTDDALSSQNQRLLSNLLDKEFQLLVRALDCIPLRNKDMILSFPQSLLPLQGIIDSCMLPINGRHDHNAGNKLVNVDILKRKLGKLDTIGSFEKTSAQAVAWAEEWNEYVKRDCAAAHLSSAATILIEAAIDYSDWIFKSGMLSAAHRSIEMSSARVLSLIALLDRVVDRLIDEGDGNVTAMSNRLLRSASIYLSTEVLLLVERLSCATPDRSHVAHFINRIGIAVLSSLERPSLHTVSTVDDEERSILLGSALLILLETDNVEIPTQTQELICSVAVAIADLTCRTVCVPSAERRQAMISMASRSILASLIGYLDNIGAGAINPFIETMTLLNSTSTSKTTLRDMVQLIPMMDENAGLLLEKIACSAGGTNALMKYGVMDALAAASITFNKVKWAPGISTDEGGNRFLASNLSLLRTLLASASLADQERDELRGQARKLLVSYSSMIVRVAETFPAQGRFWLEIVKTLALAMWTQDARGRQITFGSSKLQMLQSSPLSRGLDQLASCAVSLTMRIVEFPFPSRFQGVLPPNLRSHHATSVWWDTAEQQHATALAGEDVILPDPPTALTFGVSTFVGNPLPERERAWTRQKYETCLTGALVVDASLSLAYDRACDETASAIDVNVGALARGLCRYVDSFRAISHRLQDIVAFLTSKGIAMDLGAYRAQSDEAVLLERDCLERILPVFGRCCEKILLLTDKLFEKMKKSNEESFRGFPSVPSQEMTTFAGVVCLALQHSRLASVGVSTGASEVSEFSKNVATKLRDTLVKFQT